MLPLSLKRRLRDWKAGNWWRTSFVRRCEWQAVRRMLRVEPGQAVLEVGAGNGWASRQISRLGARVVASDIANAAFFRNSAATREQGAQTVVADAQHLPFGDGCFDHVFSVSVLEHVPDAQRAMGECLRVLRQGGTFVFTVPSLPVALVGQELRQRQRQLHNILHTWTCDDITGLARQLGATDVLAQALLCSREAVAALSGRASEGRRADHGKLQRLAALPRDYLRARRVEAAEAQTARDAASGLVVAVKMTK